MIRDVIIIGGGPGGLETGRLLAGEGFDVALFEEHPSSGEPVHCTGVLAVEAFEDPVVPSDVILNPLSTARFFAPSARRSATPPNHRGRRRRSRQLDLRSSQRRAMPASTS